MAEKKNAKDAKPSVKGPTFAEGMEANAAAAGIDTKPPESRQSRQAKEKGASRAAAEAKGAKPLTAPSGNVKRPSWHNPDWPNTFWPENPVAGAKEMTPEQYVRAERDFAAQRQRIGGGPKLSPTDPPGTQGTLFDAPPVDPRDMPGNANRSRDIPDLPPPDAPPRPLAGGLDRKLPTSPPDTLPERRGPRSAPGTYGPAPSRTYGPGGRNLPVLYDPAFAAAHGPGGRNLPVLYDPAFAGAETGPAAPSRWDRIKGRAGQARTSLEGALRGSGGPKPGWRSRAAGAGGGLFLSQMGMELENDMARDAVQGAGAGWAGAKLAGARGGKAAAVAALAGLLNSATGGGLSDALPDSVAQMFGMQPAEDEATPYTRMVDAGWGSDPMDVQNRMGQYDTLLAMGISQKVAFDSAFGDTPGGRQIAAQMAQDPFQRTPEEIAASMAAYMQPYSEQIRATNAAYQNAMSQIPNMPAGLANSVGAWAPLQAATGDRMATNLQAAATMAPFYSQELEREMGDDPFAQFLDEELGNA